MIRLNGLPPLERKHPAYRWQNVAKGVVVIKEEERALVLLHTELSDQLNRIMVELHISYI